ncbi:IlvD/Edd family dehydratase [Kocuria nitroreducens]|uniref:IlvD/Edd family dehydratase n=1 Tax=Kocuria nitroreducens TaxID=3058914 RepID=UPI0036DD189C
MTPDQGERRMLRSESWFNDPSEPGAGVLYLESLINYGLTHEELQSGRPIIGIAQSGSDLSPCNRHHLDLAKRLREGIRESGGIAFEFPMHPIQESCRRPGAALDRNLAYLGLVEILHGYPLDGVVLTTGCDKTTPAAIMAAATVDIPAIVLSGGPMLNGWLDGERVGTGTVFFKAREKFAGGLISKETYLDTVSRGAPSVGHCNTMGTATTMNSIAEGLGMSLPGCAAIPAPYRERSSIAYQTGRQIVEMVRADRKPSDILTREAFENAIILTSAIGGSTNAPIHLAAMARHAGVHITLDDWQRVGEDIPLLVNMMPAGKYLGEEFHHAGGVPAVLRELLVAGLLHGDALTVNGRTLAQNVEEHAREADGEVIRSCAEPMLERAGFRVFTGNLFRSGIMKVSAISDDFRGRYLSNPDDPEAFVGTAFVFDGPEDYTERINDPDLPIDEYSILVMRGTGPIGYPGSAEVVNMDPPARLIAAGVQSLPCIGDGRQSGTSGTPAILNIAPEAAAGGGLALLRDGDRIRVDLRGGRVDAILSDEEVERRSGELEAQGGYRYPESQTPWQEIHRATVGQHDGGMVIEEAVKYQRVFSKHPVPRHSFIF